MSSLFQKIKSLLGRQKFNSGKYWENRYKQGGNSGSGSYGRLAQFKAEVLNEFVEKNGIRSVVEFGCGDGNQLLLAKYPRYTGLDISSTIIEKCRQKFAGDPTKEFYVSDDNGFRINGEKFKGDLVLSLDVLYHLTEREVYEKYLRRLFECSSKYVIIYSSNQDIDKFNEHELHRKFTNDVERLVDNWELLFEKPNVYKSNELKQEDSSIADFFFYRKIQKSA